jgi:hypothetical protein
LRLNIFRDLGKHVGEGKARCQRVYRDVVFGKLNRRCLSERDDPSLAG